MRSERNQTRIDDPNNPDLVLDAPTVRDILDAALELMLESHDPQRHYHECRCGTRWRCPLRECDHGYFWVPGNICPFGMCTGSRK